MLNSAFSRVVQHPLTSPQPIHGKSSPMLPSSASSGGNRSPERGPLERDLSVKQWSISTYLPSHTELITYCESWECSSSIMLNPAGNLAVTCLNFITSHTVHHPFLNSSSLDLCDSSLLVFQQPFRLLLLTLLSSLLSFTDHLAVCTPQYLFLVLCSPVSLCNLFLGGGSPSHWGPGYCRCVDNSSISWVWTEYQPVAHQPIEYTPNLSSPTYLNRTLSPWNLGDHCLASGMNATIQSGAHARTLFTCFYLPAHLPCQAFI